MRDRHSLSLFDLKEGVGLFAVTPLLVFERIGLMRRPCKLVVTVAGGGEYPYGADEALVDEDAVDAALLSSSNYTDAMLSAEAMLKVGRSTAELEQIGFG